MSNNIQGKVVVITDASSGLGEARARSDRTRSADQPHRSTEGGAPITAWTSDELDKIAAAEELQIASVQRDGALRNPATIWVVRHGDDLYVRSWPRAHLQLVPGHSGAPRRPHRRRRCRQGRSLRRSRR